jgi:predicted transposase/invertase (TIGR01784 family)
MNENPTKNLCYQKRKVILTEDIEINIIEIPKIYKKIGEKENEKLIEWLSFLEAPDSKEVLSYMENNENMKKAKEKLNVISGDAKIRRIAELRKKALMDEKDAEYTGYTNGLEEGKSQTISEMVRKMKEKKTDIKYIMEITGLSEEEIKKI